MKRLAEHWQVCGGHEIHCSPIVWGKLYLPQVTAVFDASMHLND